MEERIPSFEDSIEILGKLDKCTPFLIVPKI